MVQGRSTLRESIRKKSGGKSYDICELRGEDFLEDGFFRKGGRVDQWRVKNYNFWAEIKMLNPPCKRFFFPRYKTGCFEKIRESGDFFLRVEHMF